MKNLEKKIENKAYLFTDQDIVVVIAAYNNTEYLIKCVESLKKSNDVEVKIIIIDDSSKIQIKGVFEKCNLDAGIVFIRNKSEKWWAESTQIGINVALENGARKILLMNPDVLVDSNCIFELNKHLVDLSLDVACSCIYDTKGHIWWAGSKLKIIDLFVAKIVYLRQLKHAFETNRREGLWKTDEFSGRAVLLSSKIFSSGVTLNYKKYPQYFSDTEFSLAVTINGFLACVVGSAKATVEEENSGQVNTKSNNYFKHLIKRLFNWRNGGIVPNWFLFFRAHYSFGTAFVSTFILAFRMFVHITYEWFRLK